MPLTPTDPTKAQLWINGTAPNQTIDFYIPRGAKGDPGGFALGTGIAANTDWNTLVADGIYRIAGNTGQTNMPGNYPYGILYVNNAEATPGTRVNQLFFPGTTGTNGRIIWSRGYAGGIWSSWRTYTPGRWDTAAGRVLYQWDPVAERDQLIYGDTGFRDVQSDQAWNDALFNGSSVTKNSTNIVRVRRFGATVELYYAFDRTVTNTVTMPAAFPLGFRPFSPVVALGSNSGMVLCRIYHPGAAGGLIYNNQASAASAASVTLVYTTNDAWPTTLPGTAVGSIPNI